MRYHTYRPQDLGDVVLPEVHDPAQREQKMIFLEIGFIIEKAGDRGHTPLRGVCPCIFVGLLLKG